MKKLHLKLQTPTVEIKLETSDVIGQKDSVLVAFKRYPSAEAKEYLKQYQKLLDGLKEDLDEVILKQNTDKIREFIIGQVSYIKDVSLKIQENDDISKKLTNLVIPDTRLEKDREGFWESSEEALETLLDMYLNADLWFSEFLIAVISSLSNADRTQIPEEDLKN